MARHTQLSNGAVVSTWGVYRRPCEVRHTLIVVGQHGNERGPILGAAAWSPPVGAAVTLVRLANPYGFAADKRRYLASSGEELDMNRDWGTPGTVADEIWQTVLEHVGRVPDRVIDLHSAPTHAAGAGSLGMLALTPSESTRAALAEPIAERLRSVERGWESWSPEVTRGVDRITVDSFAGTLAGWAESQGAQGVCVEFPDDRPSYAPVEGLLPGEPTLVFGNIPRRKRSIHESMIGVHALLAFVGGQGTVTGSRPPVVVITDHRPIPVEKGILVISLIGDNDAMPCESDGYLDKRFGSERSGGQGYALRRRVFDRVAGGNCSTLDWKNFWLDALAWRLGVRRWMAGAWSSEVIDLLDFGSSRVLFVVDLDWLFPSGVRDQIEQTCARALLQDVTEYIDRSAPSIGLAIFADRELVHASMQNSQQFLALRGFRRNATGTTGVG